MAGNDGLVRPEERADTRFAWAMAGLAAGVGALPLLLPTGLAPQDWPSHLARAAMLADMLRGDGPWAAFYTLNPSAWANVLVDALAVALLSAKVPFLIAARVVLVLCYLAFLGGFNALARVTAGGGAIKRGFAAVLFSNGALFYGLISYLFGLGVLMGALALWLGGGVRVRLVLATLGVAVVFACHLVAAALFAGIVAGLGLWGLAAARRWDWRHGAGLLAPVVLLAFMRGSAAGGGGTGLAWVGAPSVARMLYWKLSIFARSWLGGAPAADWALLGGAILLGGLVWRLGRPRLSPTALGIVAMTALLALLAPQRLGAGSLLDFRLALVPLLLAAAMVELHPRGQSGARLLCAAVLVTCAVRSVVLTAAWYAADRQYMALDARLARLSAGGVLLTGAGRPVAQVPWREYWSPTAGNIAALGVRHGLFVPTVFAAASQQVLVLQAAYQPWNVAVDTSDAAALDAVRQQAAGLCARFAGGVHLLVIYPSAQDLPGMERIADRFGVLDICGVQPA